MSRLLSCAVRAHRILLACSLGLLGCADVSADQTTEPDPPLLAAVEPASTAATATLARATRSTLVEGIKAAENLFISSDERLFVSGDEGIYELVRGAGGAFSADKLVAPDNCAFGGITEARRTLYANCYAFGDSYLYAAALSARPSFKRIATLSGVLLANGLSADNLGRLYVACTVQDQILRLTTRSNDPLLVEKQEIWLSGSGLFTNGLTYYAGALYWSDATTLKTARLLTNGAAGVVRNLASRLTFFDDLAVDARALVAADYLGGAVRVYGAFGRETDATTLPLEGPSAVLRADGRLGFSSAALLVTEKEANRVSLLEPR